jgi:P-type Na+/K+ transporter
MLRPPHSLKAGVFTKELIVDKFIYGTFMGCLCLVSYVVVIFGFGNGDLGEDCNENFNDSCDLPYRARGTAYSILTVLLSVMALEAKHLTWSLFNMHPSPEGGLLNSMRGIARNRFLFFAAGAGLLTPFPIIYIPVINRRVFRHDNLGGREWGLVFASLVCFVALVEAWKAIKRRRLRSHKLEAEIKESSEGSSFVSKV